MERVEAVDANEVEEETNNNVQTNKNDEEDVVDYTNVGYGEEDDLTSIRISNGIRLKDLNSDGIVFSPEMEEFPNSDETSRNYFSNHSAELENLLSSNKHFNTLDEDHEEYLNDFDAVRNYMIKISEDSGVLKRVTKEGLQTGGSVPGNGIIKIHYSLYLEGQDEPFDSSILRGKPEKYKLTDGSLISGLVIGIQTMKKHEKAQFLIDFQYAYGMYGCPPRIPGAAQILANVELIDFVEEGQAEAMLSVSTDDREKQFSFDDIEKAASTEHKNGNNSVRNCEWRIAVRHYERGIRLLQETNLANVDQEQRCQKILLKLLLNAAHCYLKLQRPKKACIVCKDALNIEENNTKALFRFGKAKRMLEDYEGARALMIKAQRRAPQDMSIAEELSSLEDQLLNDRAKEELLCKNMFGNIKSERKERIEQELYQTIYSELEQFKQQDEDSMSLGRDQMSLQQIKAIKLAASELELKVEVDESRGKGVVIISKK